MQTQNTNSRPKLRASKGYFGKVRSGVIALSVLGVAALAFSAVPSTGPLKAQLKPSDTGIIKPYARAPLTFADIVEKVKPAVVSVSVRSKTKQVVSSDKKMEGLPGIPGIPKDHPLYEFFKKFGAPNNQGTPGVPGGGPRIPSPPKMAEGSGFVISADGYVVTNNHVIDGASEITVRFDKDNKYTAELVGTDPRTDLALLKIKSDKKFPFVSFAKKHTRVGDWAVAVGNPFGLGGTVTVGIVSAHGRDIGSGPYDYLQIDAAVNRGNSGGPTFNLQGEVIGVNTAIYSPSGGNVGIAFAVPAKTAAEVIEQLKKNGTVSRGWLGVKIQNINEDMAGSLGLPEAKGALISEVTKSGPAYGAGLKVQDAIVRVNDSPITDSRDLARKIAEIAPDTTIDVGIWRDGKQQVVKVKLGRFPGSAEEIAALEQGKDLNSLPKELEKLGLSLVPVGGGDQPNSQGVTIAEVVSGSDAERKGLKPGDVILEVQGVKVKNHDDVVKGVKRALDKKRPAVLMHVQSSQGKRFVAVQLKKG